MKSNYLFLSLMFVFLSINIKAQSISNERVDFEMLKSPKILVDENQRTFKVTVTSPYNLTSDDVISQHKMEFQESLRNYDKVVLKSEKEFEQKLKDYDIDVLKAKEKFELESTEFKKLSLLERLAMTEQGKNPKLVTPAKPMYYKPSKPTYVEPNLNEYIILNNNVLSTLFNIDGFSREGSFVEVLIDIQKLNFQDNAGQTFANQPTKLIVYVNGTEKINNVFFKEFVFVSSSPSNNINKPLTEKNFLNDVIKKINTYLNDN